MNTELDVRNVQILLRCGVCGKLIDQDKLRKCTDCGNRFCSDCASEEIEEDICIDCWEEDQEEEEAEVI